MRSATRRCAPERDNLPVQRRQLDGSHGRQFHIRGSDFFKPASLSILSVMSPNAQPESARANAASPEVGAALLLWWRVL